MIKAIPMEDWLRGCIYHDGRHGYVTLPIDKVHQIANYIQRTRRSGTDGLIDLEVVEADRKTENNSEIPNNWEWSVEYAKEMLDTMPCEECGHWEHGAGDHYYCALLEMRQECFFESKGESTLMFANKPTDEPKICDTCRYYNSNIPCGSTPDACKKADKFAEEFVDGLKKLKPKVEPQLTAKCLNCANGGSYKCSKCDGEMYFKVEPQTEMTTEQIVNELLSIKKILDDGKLPKQRCGNCKHLTYRWNKTWCDIKCDNPHDMVCDKWERSE